MRGEVSLTFRRMMRLGSLLLTAGFWWTAGVFTWRGWRAGGVQCACGGRLSAQSSVCATLTFSMSFSSKTYLPSHWIKLLQRTVTCCWCCSVRRYSQDCADEFLHWCCVNTDEHTHSSWAAVISRLTYESGRFFDFVRMQRVRVCCVCFVWNHYK